MNLLLLFLDYLSFIAPSQARGSAAPGQSRARESAGLLYLCRAAWGRGITTISHPRDLTQPS